MLANKDNCVKGNLYQMTNLAVAYWQSDGSHIITLGSSKTQHVEFDVKKGDVVFYYATPYAPDFKKGGDNNFIFYIPQTATIIYEK